MRGFCGFSDRNDSADLPHSLDRQLSRIVKHSGVAGEVCR